MRPLASLSMPPLRVMASSPSESQATIFIPEAAEEDGAAALVEDAAEVAGGADVAGGAELAGGAEVAGGQS